MTYIAKRLFALGSAVTLALSVLMPSTALAAVHAVGTNVKTSNGTVWMIMQGNCRSAYTSAGAFLSYGFNSFSQVVDASAEDLALPTCTPMFIPPQDGQIIISDRGADMNTAYFISGGMKRGFTARAVYDGSGFPASRLVGSGSVRADVSWMTSGANIDNASAAHLPGALVHFVYNGHDTVFLVGSNGLLGIPDLSTFASWGYSFNNTVAANAADQAMAQAGVMAMRQPGQLSPTAIVPGPCTSNCGPVGPLSASLSSDNPASGSVVSGQATADLAHFTFTGSGTVTQVTLQRTGVSSNSTLQNVYLYNGVNRVADGASVNNSGLITFNNLNLAVNGSMNLSVKADIDPAAASGQTVGVSLTSYAVSGSSTASSVSVAGNIHTVTSGTGILATVNVQANSIPTGNVNAGATQYILWSAPVQVGTRSVWLKSARLLYVGSAPNDALVNVKLYVDGQAVGTSAGVVASNTGSYIMFDLSSAPKLLNTGSHTVDVRADIVKGSARTVQLQLQTASDLMVTDTQLNVNVLVSSPSAGSFSPNSAGVITINQGSLTVQTDPSFTSVTNVTGGSTGATIAKWKLTAYGEDEKVMTIIVTPALAGSNCANSLRNVSLFFNGAQVGSSMNSTGGALTFNLGSSMIVPAGTAGGTLEVRADLQDATNLSCTSGSVTVSGNIPAGSVQGMTSLQTNAALITLPTTSGLTLQTGLMSVAANPAYSTQTLSPNQSGVKLGSFVLQNQSSSDSVRVTNLQVSVTFGAGAGSTNLSNLRTSETSGSGATPINPATAAASGTSVNNFPVDFVLAPGASKTIDIFGDVGSAAGVTVTIQTKLLLTALSVASNSTICSPGLNVAGGVAGCNLGPGTSANGQVITFNTATIAAATLVTSSSTQAQYIAAGTASGVTDASTARYNITASGGTATIKEMQFNVNGSDVTMVKVAGQTANVVGGVAYITGLNIAIPNGAGGVNVDALVSYGPVGATGVTSGTTAAIRLEYVKYTSGGTTTVQCKSNAFTPPTTCTSTPLGANGVTAPTMELVASKPTVTVPTTQQTGLIIGAENKIGEVTVAADAAGNISMGQIVFNVGSSGFSAGAEITTPVLKNGNSPISGVTCTPAPATGGVDVTTTITCVFSPEFTISGASSQVFSLFGVITGTAAASTTVSVSTSLSSAGFLWTDVAGNGGASAEDGPEIFNFPTGSYSIRQ